MKTNTMDHMMRRFFVLSVKIFLIGASDSSDCQTWYLRDGASESCNLYIPKLNLGETVIPTVESVGSIYMQLGWQQSAEVKQQPTQVQSHYTYRVRYRIKPESDADDISFWQDGPIVYHLPEEEFMTAKMEYLLVDTLYQFRVYLGRRWNSEWELSQVPSSIVQVRMDSKCIAPAKPDGFQAHFLGSDSSGGQIELIWLPNKYSGCQTLEDYRLTRYALDNTQHEMLLYINAAATKTIVKNLQHAAEYVIILTSVNNAGYYTESNPLCVNVTKHNDMIGTNCINWATNVDTTPSSVGSTTANMCNSLGSLEPVCQTKNMKGVVIEVSTVAAMEFLIIVALCIILIITLRRHNNNAAQLPNPLPARPMVVAAGALPLPQQTPVVPRPGLPNADINLPYEVLHNGVNNQENGPYEEIHDVQYDRTNGRTQRDGYEIPHQY